MDSNLSLNLSKVSIYVSCCWLSSFCCSISYRTYSTALRISSFYWIIFCMGCDATFILILVLFPMRMKEEMNEDENVCFLEIYQLGE